MKRNIEVTIVFCFSQAKNKIFLKRSKSARQTHFLDKKMAKFCYLIVDFFNKFYQTEMKICAKESRRLKSKIEFRRLM